MLAYPVVPLAITQLRLQVERLTVVGVVALVAAAHG